MTPMFVVDAAVLLLHPPYRVARVAGRLALLPRWCAGLRRVRFPATPPAAGCVFTYAAADVRLTLQARTVAGAAFEDRLPPAAGVAADAPAPSSPASSLPVTHTAAGEGLRLTWTLSVEPPDGAGAAAAWSAALPGVVDSTATHLRARVEVVVDPEHPLAAARAALCRTVARRVPADLERLRVLLDRYEGGRAPRPLPGGDVALGDAALGDVAPACSPG